MTFAEFESHARQVFGEIPPRYREGVDGIVVERRTLSHPTLSEVLTLGECRTESYPSEFGGPGEVRSVVVLYYGSFLALSRTAEEWDWETEIWETVTHEVRHHLESLASEDALEEQDYAEDQNFARREGRPFDPFFYRYGGRVGENLFEIDGDLFLERAVGRAAFERDRSLSLRWEGQEYRGLRPEMLGDVHFVTVTGLDPGEGELILVLVRRRGVGEWVRGLFSRPQLEVLQSEVRMEEVR